MKRKTANILFLAGFAGVAGGFVGMAYNFATSGHIRNTETMRLENRVSSLENELKGDYEFKFNDVESQERYRQALQQEYEALKPAYDKAQPEIKAARENMDKYMVYGIGCLGVVGLSAITMTLMTSENQKRNKNVKQEKE